MTIKTFAEREGMNVVTVEEAIQLGILPITVDGLIPVDQVQGHLECLERNEKEARVAPIREEVESRISGRRSYSTSLKPNPGDSVGEKISSSRFHSVFPESRPLGEFFSPEGKAAFEKAAASGQIRILQKTGSMSVASSSSPLEERAKQTWNRDADIREEFKNNFASYLAFLKQSEAGNVRIFRK